MKKKLVSVLLAASSAAFMLAGCGGAAPGTAQSTSEAQSAGSTAQEAASGAAASTSVAAAPLDYKGDIKVWVADNCVDFTKKEIEQFQAANPGIKDAKFTVEAVGEGDAASNVITDVQAGADVFGFAQDQIARLVSAGGLEEVAPENEAKVKSDNDEGSVKAATVGNSLYAYPLTSDNGYFLYYDKSVVKDPSDLDKIISDCENAKKNFYFEINNGWYQTSLFFGTGCKLSYETNDKGNFTSMDADYASDKGVVALKEMIKIASSSSFQNGSSAGKATNAAAIIDGTWDAESVKKLFGDNYACAKLPSFTGSDGKTYQLSGFSGYKLLGVKPQQDEAKLAVCDALAAYLSSEEAQLARYKAVGWGPSNKAAQQSSEVKADEALSALNEQMQYDVPQGQYPADFWSLSTGLADSVITGKITSKTSDADLLATLQKFQDTCKSYVK